MTSRICKIEECNKTLWCYGYCSMHGQRFKLHGDPSYTKNERHGMRQTPEYRAWVHAKDRCYNKSDKSYYRYGGRGIRMCARWRNSFEAFYEDMGSKPSKSHTLDRIDNSGDYEPGNCRWATFKQQARNRSNNHLVTYNGKTQTMRDWADETGIPYDTLWQRLHKYKWSKERAFTQPARMSTRTPKKPRY